MTSTVVWIVTERRNGRLLAADAGSLGADVAGYSARAAAGDRKGRTNKPGDRKGRTNKPGDRKGRPYTVLLRPPVYRTLLQAQSLGSSWAATGAAPGDKAHALARIACFVDSMRPCIVGARSEPLRRTTGHPGNKRNACGALDAASAASLRETAPAVIAALDAAILKHLFPSAAMAGTDWLQYLDGLAQTALSASPPDAASLHPGAAEWVLFCSGAPLRYRCLADMPAEAALIFERLCLESAASPPRAELDRGVMALERQVGRALTAAAGA